MPTSTTCRAHPGWQMPAHCCQAVVPGKFPYYVNQPLITAIDHLFVEKIEVKPDRPAPGSPSSTLQALDLSQGTCSSFPTQLLLGSIVAESPPCPVQAMPSYMPFPPSTATRAADSRARSRYITSLAKDDCTVYNLLTCVIAAMIGKTYRATGDSTHESLD